MLRTRRITILSALVAGALTMSSCAGSSSPVDGSAADSSPRAAATSGPGAAHPQADRLLAAHGLQGLDAVTLVERLDALAVEQRPAGLIASVRPTEVLLSEGGGEPVALPILGDRFYLSIAPYAQQTHDCHFHSLTTCLGELRAAKVHLTVERADTGEVIVDTDTTTYDNGFVGVWLPRGIDATVRIAHDGRTATRTVRTGAQDATCLTTAKLT